MASRDVASLYTDGEYARRNPSWHVEDSPWKAQQILRAMSMLPAPPHTICEVGCGAGEILRQLDMQLPQDAATKIVGYDISPQALELARSRESSRLHFVLGDATADAAHFDLCLCVDVFEHVEDCYGFLRNLRNKADFFILHIPLDLNCESLLRNFVMETRRLYGHVHYFTRDTASAMLQECGYELSGEFYTHGYKNMPPGLKNAVVTKIRAAIFKALPRLSPVLINGLHVMVVARAGRG